MRAPAARGVQTVMLPMTHIHSFRQTHPEQQALLGSVPWTYCAGGSGPRGLLVLGGALSFGDTSHRLVTLFEPTRRVLSPSYPRVDSVAEVADGLVRMLDREGLERVDVFGHSLGAGIAHALVRRHPDRVDRIALSSFGLYTPLHALEARAFLWAMRWLPAAVLLAWWRRMFERLARDAGPTRGAQLMALADELLARHRRGSLPASFELMADLCRHAGEHRLTVPVHRPGRVMLMFANDDKGFTRAEQDALVETWPGAIVTRFLSGGHLIGLTHAQELHKKLEYFFRVTPQASGRAMARPA